jgi:uncharacterized repeat protein (TIGR03837 family)
MNKRQEKNKPIFIDIISKVVDNFGDAGVALRLLRAFATGNNPLEIRLFIDKPDILEKLLGRSWEFNGPGTILQLHEPEETLNLSVNMKVYDWKSMPSPGDNKKPDLLIEMFGSGLPELYWPALLNVSAVREKKGLWLNLEYLTAEPWAIDYHKTASLSPYPEFDRYFFMPGFTSGLGGLIMDGSFLTIKKRWDSYTPEAKSKARIELLKNLKINFPASIVKTRWISIFSYQKDFTTLIDQINDSQNITVFLSPGKAVPDFLTYREKSGKNFECLTLPFLAQKDWDEFLLACDINFIRGEESLSRASLSGRPFIWQAYPLECQEHMEKVDAFCDILCPENRELKELFHQYNSHSGGSEIKKKENFSLLWRKYEILKLLYSEFSEKLENNGDCAQNIMLFFQDYDRLLTQK